MLQLRMPLVPCVGLLVRMRQAKNPGFIESASDKLQTQRQIGRGKTARYRHCWKTGYVSECETAAADGTYRVRHRKIGDIDWTCGRACGGRNEGSVPSEKRPSVIADLV